MRTILICLSAFTLAAPALAAQQPQMVMVKVNSGTGFFVNRDGHILTNDHVVQNCKSVRVQGPVRPAEASIIARDAQNDLALLKTDVLAPEVGELRSEYFPLSKEEPVVTVGFPGLAGLTTREADIVDIKGPAGEEQWVQFTDSVAQGNSGGPLLDRAASVVGVVVAKAAIYRYNTDGARNDLVRTSDIAIALPVVRRFLDDNRVRYRESTRSGELAAHRVEDRAKDFIVHVLCEQ